MTESSYTLTVYQDTKGEWRWRLTHANGQIVGASSEGFSSESEARANLRRVRDALQAVTFAEPA